MENRTDSLPPENLSYPPLPAAVVETQHPIWVGLVELFTAVLAGLWVPVKVGLLRGPGSTDLWVDLLFLVCAGTSACQALHAGLTALHSGARRAAVAPLIRAVLGALVALPAVTLAALGGSFPDSLWCLKLLALRHLLHFPAILYRLGLPYPALGRLITLGLSLPLGLHWTATGWIMLGADADLPDLGLRYVRAVYWAIATMASVGYGDITPQNVPQMVYACCIMLVGVGTFAFTLGNAASFLARLDAAEARREDVRDRVEAFMRQHRVPAPLRRRVRDYYRFLRQSRRVYDGGVVLAELPSSLKSDLLLCVNRDIVRRAPLLKDASPDLLRDLILELKPRVVLPGDIIFAAGMPVDGMYFLLDGDVDIFVPQGEIVIRLGEGSFFGEMALLTNSPRNATARAANHCFLFLLERRAFEQAIHRYPEFESQVAEMARLRAGG